MHNPSEPPDATMYLSWGEKLSLKEGAPPCSGTSSIFPICGAPCAGPHGALFQVSKAFVLLSARLPLPPPAPAGSTILC